MCYKTWTDGWLSPKRRQKLVNLITHKFVWRFMPISAKLWAFMNDDELKDDYKFNNKSKSDADSKNTER